MTLQVLSTVHNSEMEFLTDLYTLKS